MFNVCVHNVFNMYSVCSQEAAKPDPDARWRAEQPELERSYLFVFRPLLGMPYRSLQCVSVFAFISHVSVAAVVSLYEGCEMAAWPCVVFFSWNS